MRNCTDWKIHQTLRQTECSWIKYCGWIIFLTPHITRHESSHQFMPQFTDKVRSWEFVDRKYLSSLFPCFIANHNKSFYAHLLCIINYFLLKHSPRLNESTFTSVNAHQHKSDAFESEIKLGICDELNGFLCNHRNRKKDEHNNKHLVIDFEANK